MIEFSTDERNALETATEPNALNVISVQGGTRSPDQKSLPTAVHNKIKAPLKSTVEDELKIHVPWVDNHKLKTASDAFLALFEDLFKNQDPCSIFLKKDANKRESKVHRHAGYFFYSSSNHFIQLNWAS